MAQPILPVSAQSEINGLYVTLYDVPATAAGFQFWLNDLMSFDHTVTNAGSIINPNASATDANFLGVQMTAGAPVVNGTTYFATLYPASISDTQFVQDLYQNMAGFGGTAAGVQFWDAQLATLEASGDTVIQAREAIAGQFVQGFLENNLSLGAAFWGVDQADFQLLVNGQQALLNKIAASEFWADNSSADNGLLNYTAADLNGTVPLGPNNPFSAGMHLINTVTSDPASLTAAENAIIAAIAADSLAPIDNLVVPPLTGTTIDLTTNIDHVSITTPGTVDHVEGVINQPSVFGEDLSTYSGGDTIAGNGNTIVDVAIDHINPIFFGPVAAVQMSGVSTVNFHQDQFITTNVPAGLWTNVNNITLTGLAGNVHVSNMNVTNGLGIHAQVTTTAPAFLSADGKVSGYSYDLDLQSGINGVGSVAAFGKAGVDASLGASGSLEIVISQFKSNTKAGGGATVGDISIGHVNVKVGSSASAGTVAFSNFARAVSANAQVGNITLGNVNYTVANGGVASLTVSNFASVLHGKGNATAGNITIGNVVVHEAGNGSFGAFITNQASQSGTKTGNATVGNITVGNVSIAGGKSTQNSFSVNNEAFVRQGNGNATAGNVTVGNVSFSGNDGAFFSASNFASVAKNGNATVGNVQVGNISEIGGNHAQVSAFVFNTAIVDGKGNAQAGNVTVGSITLQGSHGAVGTLSNNAFAEHTGTATVGNIQVGNITVNNVKGNFAATFDIFNSAIAGSVAGAGGAATAGNVTVGNVSLAGATHNAAFTITNTARNDGTKAANATVGSVTVGNVSLQHNADKVGTTGGAQFFSVTNHAFAAHGNASNGNVTVGNITINGGGLLTGATNGAATVHVYNSAVASNGVASVGNVTVGNVTAVTGASGFLQLSVTALARGTGTGDKTGLVTVGNVSMKGASGALMRVNVSNTASSGSAGGITVGNVSIVGTKALGTADLFVTESGATAGKVTVGNVNLTAKTVNMNISNFASSGPAGGLSVGNVTIRGNEGGIMHIKQSASNGHAGALTVGNVSLSDGRGQVQHLDVSNLANGAVGAVGIGNVNIAVHNTNNKVTNATGQLHVSSSSFLNKAGGNITTGNITVGVSGLTTKATVATVHANILVTLDAKDGNVTIGNIAVSGGVVEAAGAKALTDHLNIVAPSETAGTNWLNVSANGGAGTVTVGNIDYSGYAGNGAWTPATPTGTLIDVSTWKGGGDLIGATNGSTIMDNTGTNTLDVSHTTKADFLLFEDHQSWLTDSGGTITAAQTSVDTVIGAHVGDTIFFQHGNGAFVANDEGISGAGVVQNGAISYATFLNNAETQIHGGTGAYAATVGGNTYVALNHGGVVGDIIDFTGLHTFSLTAGDLHVLT